MKKLNWRRFELNRMLNPPDVMTFLNLTAGLASIVLSAEKLFLEAMVALLVSVLFDYLDGKTATFMNRKSEFGKQMDSLADLVSFGVAPGFYGYRFIEAHALITPLVLLIILFFITCGMIRLARYNIMNYQEGFVGMPITVNGVLFPFLYYAGIPVGAYPLIFIISGALMISPLRIRRLP